MSRGSYIRRGFCPSFFCLTWNLIHYVFKLDTLLNMTHCI